MTKIEQAPHPGSDFIKRVMDDPKLFATLRAAALAEQEYHPWRHVKYHAPEGIDARDLWAALLFVRAIRPVARLDNGHGGHFSLAHPEALKRRVDNVYRALNFSIETDSPFKGLDSDRRRMYIQRSLREEAISSSQLEGAVTTRRVAREMLLTKREPKDRSERMILNNYLTMERLGEWKDKPLSLQLLKDIHGQLTEGELDDSQRGRFKQSNDDVVVANPLNGEVVHYPPSCEGLEERLRKLVDFANAGDEDGVFYYPVEKAAILHFMIGYEHPFCDGNGRTARAVFYWYLLRKGWWLVEFLSISSLLKRPAWRKRYEQAYLDVETCGFDLTYFVLFQMDCLVEAAKELHAHIDREQKDAKAIEGLLRGVLNQRQLDLVRHARRHDGYVYTAAEHASWQGISLNSARTDLEGLRTKGFLELSKRGRTKVYTYKGN
jgi:Fic family protein